MTTDIEADLRAKAEAARDAPWDAPYGEEGWAAEKEFRDWATPQAILALLDAHKAGIEAEIERRVLAESDAWDLNEALRKYGRHLEGCRSLLAWPDREPCTCGLDAANGDA